MEIKTEIKNDSSTKIEYNDDYIDEKELNIIKKYYFKEDNNNNNKYYMEKEKEKEKEKKLKYLLQKMNKIY